MSRTVVVAAALLGAAGLAVCGLAALGAPEQYAGGGEWTGWTGRVDTVAVADKAAMTPDDDVAVSLLARSARAATQVGYAGVVATQDSTGTRRTSLLHVVGSGTVAVPVGEGAQRAVLSPEGRSGSFADEGRVLDLLRVNYRVLREADLDTTVAGRPADAVVAVDADGVLSARYWLDRATGLLLRRELVDPSGAVRDRTGFETFSPGASASDLASATASPPADAWTEKLDDAGLVDARAAGCACPESLPGGLTLVEARRAPAGAVGAVPVVHQLFSDGLVTVSLFSLRGTLSADDLDGLRTRGFTSQELGGWNAWVRARTAQSSTSTVVWQCGSSVLTLVTDDAEDPTSVAATVIAAVPPVDADVDASFLARVARGWDKLTGAAS